MKHCDDYINDFKASKALRFFLLINRLPAVEMALCREFGVVPTLFADYNGERVRVVMASRLGDLGISKHLDQEDGYFTRVPVSALTNFGDKP